METLLAAKKSKSFTITCTSIVPGRDVKGECSCGNFGFLFGDSRLVEVGKYISEHLAQH